MATRSKVDKDPILSVSVPNRVDLAGGTLDIFPLYLLVPGSKTVNAAISVESVVEVRYLSKRRAARIVSANYGISADAPDTHGFAVDGKLGLLSHALRFHEPLRGVEFLFRNEAPVGSGIGASSALLVATLLALDRLAGIRRPWEETARAAMEIEACHLGTLTGRQDHLAALRGGVQGIDFIPGRVVSTRLPPTAPFPKLLAAHGVLADTGKAHHSGATNWRMIRRAIEGDAAVLGKFRKIAAAANEAWAAVSAGDPGAAADAVAAEWAVRKTLAPGITTPAVEKALSSRTLGKLLRGAKLCGAGGGGMLFGILRDPSDRAAAEDSLRSAGFSVLPFHLSAGPRYR